MENNEIISAFAFRTGIEIEQIIKDTTNNLVDINQDIQAKILQWYMKTKDEEFAKFIGIKTHTHGKIN